MQKAIHPEYFPAAKVSCACGATYTVGSTREKLNVEICRACHPFYTGGEKLIDTAGRVERFKVRRAKAAPEKQATKKATKVAKRVAKKAA